MVGCHAGGEIGNVVVGGVLPPAGDTVFEQMETLRREGDWLRRVLLREPRGSVACHANLVVPPTREDCDAGFIIMEPTEYPAMSGSNTICVTTVLLETGMIEMREPETVVRLEAPGGVVEARAACRDGKCESVEFTNVPCFVGQLDAELEVEGLGNAHGRRRLRRHVVRDRRREGARLRDQAGGGARPLAGGRGDPSGRARAARVRPSREPGDRRRQHRPDRGALARRRRGDAERGRRRAGRLDRSATGTGLSARLAVLHARGQMKVGDSMTHASPIGSTFDGRIVEETRVGDRAAIVPAIRGSAWITGITQVLIDPSDPFPEGYLLSDTWGVSEWT